MGDLRLHVVGIAATVVGMIADMVGVEAVHEPERAVVDGKTENRHVVGIHHAVHEADRLPAGHHVRGAAHDFADEQFVTVRPAGQFGIKLVDHEVCQCANRFPFTPVVPVLEGAEAHEGRGKPRDHRGGFHRFADHRLVRADNRHRPGGRDAKGVHGLRAEVFADRRAQHGAAVAHARVGRQAGPLELYVAQPLAADCFAQRHGAAVPEARHILAELVA